jgi:predicted aminopeptidase
LDLLKAALLFGSCYILCSCQLGYFLKSGAGQVQILTSGIAIEKAINDSQTSADDKQKLILSQEAIKFAQSELHLKASKNYTSFVKLDRPYVTYVVSAAPKWEFKHHLFKYPIVGSMPYKGFFKEQDAKEEAEQWKKQNFDVYLRGVSAYSTLGWFNDPLLSSMLRYSDHDLVNTIIHETVHATLYIKNSADFNERLATFVGNIGTEKFYLAKEGDNSPTVKKIKEENSDDMIFSKFITEEIGKLETYYKTLPAESKIEEHRNLKFKEIQARFISEIQPKLLHGYKGFESREINNAYLLIFKTYMQDLSDFEELYDLSGKDMQRFLQNCKDLESHQNPEQGLKELIKALKT